MAIVPDKHDDVYLISQSQMKLTPDPTKADVLFLYYVFKSPGQQKHIINSAIQTGVPHTNLSILRQTKLVLPSLHEQQVIANLLGTIDDKIELNQRMNETLEEIARAIFKSWFVDFDPVNGHANLTNLRAKGFPKCFQDSSLGKIPQGWEIGVLEDLFVLQRGFDLPSSSRTPGPYPVIAASGLCGTHSQFQVKGPGVTTGRSGVLGKVFFVHEDFWPLNTSLWVKEFRGSRPVHAYYTLQNLDAEVFNAGSAVPTLNRNHVHRVRVVVPPLPVVEEFETLARPLFAMIRENERQSETLTSVRDTLLPKLISGEIRLGEEGIFD